MIDILIVVVIVGVSTGISVVITDSVRRLAIARNMVDVPNHRSLHQVPIPRGGGLGIVLVAFTAITIVAFFGLLQANIAIGMLGSGAAIAIIGWIDDKAGVPASLRILVHFAAAAWTVYWLGGLPQLDLGRFSLHLGWAGAVIAVITLVWLINLYNFMDGIDGIAATEAAWVAAIGGLLLHLEAADGMAIVCFAISGAALGFLVRNWAPAKIFMGDVASGLLGFLFGAAAIASEHAHTVPLLSWVVLLGVFVVDATVTLLRRVSRGERWHTAHRAHAYQRLAQAGWTHSRISVGVFAVNIVLAALVVISQARRVLIIPTLLVAMGMLAILYVGIERVLPFSRQDT